MERAGWKKKIAVLLAALMVLQNSGALSASGDVMDVEETQETFAVDGTDLYEKELLAVNGDDIEFLDETEFTGESDGSAKGDSLSEDQENEDDFLLDITVEPSTEDTADEEETVFTDLETNTGEEETNFTDPGTDTSEGKTDFTEPETNPGKEETNLTETGNETESETESETETESESEIETETESEIETESESEIETETESEIESETESEIETENEWETESDSEVSSYPLAETAAYTAYDNESADGTQAAVHFLAGLPAGTEFFRADGTPADPVQTVLILKARTYLDSDGAEEMYRNLADAHIENHTGGVVTADDVQLWRLWLEDEAGEEIEVKLPAGTKAEVTVEYLPGEDGSYPGALRGELNVFCSGVLDMGRPGEGVTDPETFTETEQYTLTVSSDPTDTQKTESYYTKLTYYMAADENGASPWGHVTAFAAVEPDGGVTAANIENIPEDLPKDILQKLAEKYQIYPGVKTTDDDGSEIWTAYDAADEESAGTRVIATFPQDIEITENHYLYLRAVEKENDPYYPTEEALTAAVGEYNDMQCWAIHWVKIWEEDGEWKYDVQPKGFLGENDYATVRIDYLKKDAQLKGPNGQRKLQVYNSRKEDGSELEDAGELTDVTATDDSYTSFTYRTNRGGPYVFVNNKVYEGYVKSFDINSITDGSAPFDADNEAGNDSGSNNRIIRSYDVIEYSLTANFAARHNGATATTAEMGFEMEMDADITAAVFDTGSMLWLGEDYTIDYLDKDGSAVLTQSADGRLVDKDGAEKKLNDIAFGSGNGESSYTTGIVRQRLRGTVSLKDDRNILAANQTFKTVVQVLGAHNGSTIQPNFRAWFVGNKENYGPENEDDGNIHLAQKVTANEKRAEAVKVSAAARFNLELKKAANVSYKGWFDSSAGKEIGGSNRDSYTVAASTVTGAQLYTLLEKLAALEENTGKANPEEFTDKEKRCADVLNGAELSDYREVFKRIRYGRITGYGITIQMYNKATNEQNTASKGFKGVSLPQGSVSFDLNLKSGINVSEGGADESQYYSQLWEYNENVDSAAGNQNKNMYWASLEATKYASWAAPYNSHTDPENALSCYNGGAWALGGQGNYHFTVGGYDLNFLSTRLNFPTHQAGSSGASKGYNTYIGCFSAGYVQVLNVLPRYQNATLNMDTVVTVKNLAVTTVDNQEFSAREDDSTGYAHETNTGDNTLTDSIPLYEKGGMTKANAFGTAKLFENKSSDFTSKEYFLGTYFWGTSYDCSAFAGQEVTLVGAARISAGDYKIRHMNILQLFDSKALSIHGDKKPYAMSNVRNAVKGTTNILYAADPDYKAGYDTQNKDVMHYMSTVREEDLVYYESLEELESEGYTCVGVMAELRNWTINAESGYQTALKIPMDVSQDAKFLGKTVGTVNTVRIWTNAADMGNGSVSWKNGSYDASGKKNSVEGYTPVDAGSDEHYSGEVSNGTPYEKTEYENGQIKLGSNTGGYLYGTSLLILSYKSEIDIEVDNGGGGSLPTFDLDNGSCTVEYRLKDIIARRDETNGSAQDAQTSLTVLAELDTGRNDGGTDQRIAVASGSYRMEPASDKMKLTDKDGKALDEQSVKISSDPNKPTTVHYAFIDETTGEIDKSKIYTIQVYAVQNTDGTQVKYELADVTIGVSVPDITYDALIDPKTVKDSDRIHATAKISGTSDVRAYSETAGNMDSTTIGITQLQGTRLVKSVDRRYIELDGAFTYTVTYTNSGQEPVNVYLYDLKPAEADIRGSKFDGDMIFGEISADLSGGDEFTAEIDFYYSKLDYQTLYDLVKVFGDEDGRDKDKVENMLKNEDYFKPFGKISSANNHVFQRDDSLNNMTEVELKEEMNAVTGLYAVIRNLGGNKALSIRLSGQTEGNRAGDLYRNIANSWLGDASEPLTSNLVETSVLSRTISGVVWYDKNLNGVRDSNEQTISGVTCTLFKWDEGKNQYEPVDWNGGPNTRPIEVTYQMADGGMRTEELSPKSPTSSMEAALTTGADGSYRFSNLAAGEYIVAFSGDVLEGYTGATTYRINGRDDGTTNDAVELIDTASSMNQKVTIAGIDSETYSYAIAYS